MTPCDTQGGLFFSHLAFYLGVGSGYVEALRYDDLDRGLVDQVPHMLSQGVTCCHRVSQGGGKGGGLVDQVCVRVCVRVRARVWFGLVRFRFWFCFVRFGLVWVWVWVWFGFGFGFGFGLFILAYATSRPWVVIGPPQGADRVLRVCVSGALGRTGAIVVVRSTDVAEGNDCGATGQRRSTDLPR